ncbi:MAG: GC-type dockerin domain-anchored protein [Phycisphaerales bacterium JB047]
MATRYSTPTITLAALLTTTVGSALAQEMPQTGDLLISAIDTQTGLPDIFVITPNGLVGANGLMPNEYASTVELAPVTPVTQTGLVFNVVDNGSGMLRHTYFGDGANEGGPVYTSLIDRELGFDSFDSPIVAFDNPSVAFDHPTIAFTPGMIGLQHPMRANMPDFFEDKLFGFEDPSFGFEDPSFGFEDPSFGFTANSAVISYATLGEEYEFAISGGTVSAGLAYPRSWFIDPDEVQAFDGVDGQAHTHYAGFAIFLEGGRFASGIYLAPLDRVSIENRSLDLYPFAVDDIFDGSFDVDGMHIDPVIPGNAFVWGTDGVTRGGSGSQAVIYSIDSFGSVTELTRGGELQAIGDMVVSNTGTIYVVDPTTPAGKIIAIDSETGVQSVLATGGDVFEQPLSISVVQQRATITEVSTTADFHDANPGDGYAGNASFQTSLRSAIEEANAQGGAHTIVLPAGTYGVDSLPEIDIEESDITIVGAGAESTIITGSNASRIFTVLGDASLRLRDLTIEDGRANVGHGGCIYADGPLALEDVVIRSGFAAGDGGAVYSTAPLHVYRSHFVGNHANGKGGAIAVSAGHSVIDRSSFFENEAVDGGALSISNAGVDIMNSTFYLNFAFVNSGAIHYRSSSPLRVLHSTFLENEAGVFPDGPSAGGIDSSTSASEPIIKSSVFAYNTFDGELADVYGNFSHADHSLFTTLDGATFGLLSSVLVGENPVLAGTPTQIGVTRSFAPLPGSPLIDTGATDEFPAFDQLGYVRSLDGDGDLTPAPDMGAYEAEGVCPADLTGDGELNFFDVSAFLAAYSAMDPAADFTGDGLFNFFDVSVFLSAYSSGCP